MFKFQGHYNEGDLNITIPRDLLKQANNKVKMQMVFNPYLGKGTWEFVMGYDANKIPLDPIEINQLAPVLPAK